MKSKRFLIIWLMAMVVVTIGAASVSARNPQPFESPLPPPGEEWPPVPPVDLGGIEEYVGLVGLGGVITVVVEVLKRLKVVPDGQAGRWTTIANIVGFAVLVGLGVLGVDYTGDAAAGIFDLLERIGQAVLLVISSPLFFQVLRSMGVFPQLKGR